MRANGGTFQRRGGGSPPADWLPRHRPVPISRVHQIPGSASSTRRGLGALRVSVATLTRRSRCASGVRLSGDRIVSLPLAIVPAGYGQGRLGPAQQYQREQVVTASDRWASVATPARLFVS